MRSAILVTATFLAALAAFAACESETSYSCQALCSPTGGSGGVIGGNGMYSISARSESEAATDCTGMARQDGSACPAGDEVVSCSCDED